MYYEILLHDTERQTNPSLCGRLWE